MQAKLRLYDDHGDMDIWYAEEGGLDTQYS